LLQVGYEGLTNVASLLFTDVGANQPHFLETSLILEIFIKTINNMANTIRRWNC